MTDSAQQIIDKSDRHMLSVYPHALQLVFSHGQGSRLFDSAGQEYLDFSSGLGVCSLGYCEPGINAVASRVIAKGVHCSNLFYHQHQLELACLLTEHSGLDRVFFSNSGCEANELAIKAARKFGASQQVRRHRIICFENGWHGRSLATISACKDAEMQSGFEPLLEGFDPVPVFDLAAIRSAINSQTVAVMIEPVLGHGGILVPPAGFLKELRRLCNEHGLLLILDEIQTGLGRCGSLFYYQQEDILPDIVTLAKALGNGYPIGATLLSSAVASHMTVGSHGSTNGGNLLSTSVASYVLSTVSSPDFLKNLKQLSELLISEARTMLLPLEQVESVRTVGLLAGISVKINARKLIYHLARTGVITTALGTGCVRLMPALNISASDLKEGLALIKQGIESFEE